ncbi:uncharacterized protein PV09_01156 [Verruconis gallopava]|uniref:Transcription factor domain-containing protein n=1 Tax=Verruconis gallopava TaxID=253628 RepID=A0A0D2ANC5_9PEZI|nr:uncharacterized protein PV09_01156 [Verruconis gallopava]KIW08228.1 hypothetical protein PV09_01156 [Verruconis gallopava]
MRGPAKRPAKTCAETVSSQRRKTGLDSEPTSHQEFETPSACKSTVKLRATAESQPERSSCSGEEVTFDLSERMRYWGFPEFLLPGKFGCYLKGIQKAASSKALEMATPLLPFPIVSVLVPRCFEDIMAGHKVLELPEFMEYLDAQYRANTTEPAGEYARWSLVNAVLGLAVRSKIAPGSEKSLGSIPDECYKNATLVLHRLIFEPASLLSIQALLVMAIYAKGVPDSQAFVMLVTIASRQFELIKLGLMTVGVTGGVSQEKNSYDLIREIIHKFSVLVDSICGARTLS